MLFLISFYIPFIVLLGDVTYFSASRTPWNHISVSFTKSTMVNYLQRLSSIESSPGCDLLRVLNGRYTNLSYQKTWRCSNLTSLPPFWIDIDREHSFTLLPQNYLYGYALAARALRQAEASGLRGKWYFYLLAWAKKAKSKFVRVPPPPDRTMNGM